MTRPIRILIADDHPVVRSGLESMLAKQPDFEVVGEAEDGMEAVRLAKELSPDVILMDLRMPEMDGAAATGKISKDHPETRVLVLTTYDTDADILRAVEAGATGYLLKDAPREELYEAVRSTASGKPLLTPAVTAMLMRSIREPRPQKPSAREDGELTAVLTRVDPVARSRRGRTSPLRLRALPSIAPRLSPPPAPRGCASRPSSRDALYLGERLLYGVQVRRVGRREQKRRAPFSSTRSLTLPVPCAPSPSRTTTCPASSVGARNSST